MPSLIPHTYCCFPTSLDLSVEASQMVTSDFSELAIVMAGSSAGAVIASPLYLRRPDNANVKKPRAGTELGPRAILNSGLLEDLRGHFAQVHVCDINQRSSDDACVPDFDHVGMRRPRTVSKATLSVHELVYDHAQQNRLVLTLGGDHSNAIGTLTGTTRATKERLCQGPAVICVDAHVSINPPEMSPSGNIHGMPLAFVTGLARSREKGIFDWIIDEYIIDINRLVYIGTRDVDDGEKRLIEENRIKVFDMKDIQRSVSWFTKSMYTYNFLGTELTRSWIWPWSMLAKKHLFISLAT